jgi:hypothetical protein
LIQSFRLSAIHTILNRWVWKYMGFHIDPPFFLLIMLL